MCSQGWEARPPLVAAYSNLKFKLGYNCRVNPLVLEELGKNADSASFRFRHQGPGICISVHRLPHPIPKPLPARSRDPGTPGPRRPGSKTTQRETAAKNGADPARQVTEAWSRERGAVELIGVLAQTGWVLMRPEGTPPGTR